MQLAVDAMKLGAHDYLSKPVSLSELELLLDKAMGQTRLEGALACYHDRQARHSGLSNILGESPAVVALKEQVGRFIDFARGSLCVGRRFASKLAPTRSRGRRGGSCKFKRS